MTESIEFYLKELQRIRLMLQNYNDTMGKIVDIVRISSQTKEPIPNNLLLDVIEKSMIRNNQLLSDEF